MKNAIRFTSRITALVLAAGLAACNSSSGEQAPATLAYAVSPALYTVGTAVTPNTPTTTGGTPSSWTVTPALPAGLALSATTGVISGTPTAAAAAASFTVAASNGGGSAQVVLSITVRPQPPATVTYPVNPAVYTAAAPITPNTPTTTGGTPSSWSVTPALPAGLALSATTGVISGTPAAAAAAAIYTVTASNAGGTAQATVGITVLEQPPATLAYAVNPAIYTAAAAITPNTPTTTGGTPSSWSVAPALPAGLTLSTTTGVISGTPTVVSAVTGYTVTASNSGGSALALLSITVRAPAAPVITQQPVTQVVAVGDTATFAVTATGTGTLSYQWRKDGVNVSGATEASYTTPASTADQDGAAFDVVVGDAYTNAITSNVARLRFPGFITNPPAPMAVARQSQGASKLGSGKVLVSGGQGVGDDILASAEIYDPNLGIFTPTNPMLTARQGHTSTVLADGFKVLVTGGLGGVGGGVAIATAEVYDANPGHDHFDAASPMPAPRYNHTATLLSDGKVLIAGGRSSTATYLSSALLFDPVLGTFTPTTGAMTTARYLHTATRLPDGKVLVTGGTGSLGVSLDTAELYDPATGLFTVTATTMIAARSGQTATLLLDGMVLLAGGFGTTYLASAEVYDPATDDFLLAGSMSAARASQTATLLPGGKVLVAGGQVSGGGLASAEIYDPTAGTFAATLPMNVARYYDTATLLDDGEVLVVGGWSLGGQGLSSAELYSGAP
jgi:hypothetical protein